MSHHQYCNRGHSEIDNLWSRFCFGATGILLIIGMTKSPILFASLIYTYFLVLRMIRTTIIEEQGIKLEKPCNSCYERTVTKYLIHHKFKYEISCSNCGSIGFEKVMPSVEQKSFWVWCLLLILGLSISKVLLLVLAVLHGVCEYAYRNKARLIKIKLW